MPENRDLSYQENFTKVDGLVEHEISIAESVGMKPGEHAFAVAKGIAHFEQQGFVVVGGTHAMCVTIEGIRRETITYFRKKESG